MRILLVEDDKVLLNVLLETLTRQHYVVDVAEDGQTGWDYAQSTSYDLILLDVGLPELDGIALCQRLRTEKCTSPILLMTAREANGDRVRGLDSGADDYLIKPLDLAELQARIRALLRRGEVAPTTVLQWGQLRLDPRSCQVQYGEKVLGLTPKEYSLLEVFLRNPARVFSRGQLVEHLWTFDDPPQEDSVKAHIKGLRQKLKAAGAADWIENVYGLGYRLRQETNDRPTESPVNPKSSDKETLPLSPAPVVEMQFHQGLDHLWKQSRELMTERLAVLQQAVAAVEQNTLAIELRQAARQAAHKLAGVLGMFDRPEGTVLARQIEEILLGQGDCRQEDDLGGLVQQLDRLLDLQNVEPVAASTSDRLLLIDPDPALGQALQQLGQAASLHWQQVDTLEAAKLWLQSHTPDLVVLSIDGLGQRELSLVLLAELAARTPAIPVLVIASADGLLDRVTVARSGGQAFLVQPMTAAQVWASATQLLQQAQSRLVRVLVVDDDPIFLTVLRSMLEPWGMRFTGLDQPLQFWDVLRSTDPDLLILDVDMPQVSGIELCQAVRTDPTWQGLPILFLTAHSDRDTIQQGFAAGADDYVTKPVVGAELITRITNRLDRAHLLQTLSSRDPLTGLTNQSQSSRELEQSLTESQPFCLAVFVVVELAQLNLQYGHATGHQVLQAWGRRLQMSLRRAEIVSYWGNGEFVIGLPGVTKLEAMRQLSELQTALQQQQFTDSDGRQFQAIVHVGLAAYPTDGVTLQSLYQAASQHLS
ncbi:response regulator [Stenomitos frigidus]|uniref:Multi-component transcriptional regulator n=1 Tax=Stenomitos frigidus ULC18 TaxID=2107698 RepID=A0A2T1EB90_9CYAN|nr:response regulator [Stenomitos frigidus]PSB30026.1 multi-component transcriptional regulator [Stenomitos frigidus ULC18]